MDAKSSRSPGVWVGAVAGGVAAVALAVMACLLFSPVREALVGRDGRGVDVLAAPGPRPGPPPMPRGALSQEEHLRWVSWGEEWFRGETFGNERIFTDVIGLLNGTVEVPRAGGGSESQPVLRFFVQAIDALDGVKGNLYEGNGGPYGTGFTQDLVLTFPKGTTLDGSLEVPERLHTGLDVEAGSAWPLGIVPVPAPAQEQSLPYLLDPAVFAQGPDGVGPPPAGGKLRVGFSCALCHYSLDVDWDGKPDLRSLRYASRQYDERRGEPLSQYLPEQAWAVGNQDISLGWLGALAANSTATFVNSGPAKPEFLNELNKSTVKNARDWVQWIIDNYQKHPAQTELEVDRGFLMMLRGFADDTPDGLHNPLQFPSLYTYLNWPYNYDGVMLNASDRNNNVWTNGLDPTQFVALCKDRGGRVANLMFWNNPGTYSIMTARQYADLFVAGSPAVKYKPERREELIQDILGNSDGVPGLLRNDSQFLIPGVPFTLPKEVLNHPDNQAQDRLRKPADYGPVYASRGPMIGLLGTRVRTPPEVRQKYGIDELEQKYGLDPNEFLTEAVSLMLDWAEPPPNLSPMLARARAEGLVAQGYQVFKRAGCEACHSGPMLTNNTIEPLEQVGTNSTRAVTTAPLRTFLAPLYSPETGLAVQGGPCGILCKVFGGSAPGYKVVTLRYLWGSAPYLHDGGVGVALRPEAGPVGDDLAALLRRPPEDKIYGIGQILARREQEPDRYLRADAALSLQAVLLQSERDKVMGANREPSYPVAGQNRKVAAASLSVEGIGHQRWIKDEPGGKDITALVAFLLALDNDPGR